MRVRLYYARGRRRSFYTAWSTSEHPATIQTRRNPLPPYARFDLPRRRQVGLGACFVTLLFLGETPIVEGAGVDWIEQDRVVIILDGAVGLTFVLIGVAAIEECIGVFRIELDRLVIVLDGAVVLFFVLKRGATIKEGAGVFRI